MKMSEQEFELELEALKSDLIVILKKHETLIDHMLPILDSKSIANYITTNLVALGSTICDMAFSSHEKMSHISLNELIAEVIRVKMKGEKQ